MTDDFEPNLGTSGRDKFRPTSQLKAVARHARKGKPHAFGRTKLAPGTVWSEGRGKGAAAVTRHWQPQSNRRVFVRATIAPARGANAAAFSSHIKYLLRDQTDTDGRPGTLYDRETENVDPLAFKQRSRNDPWQFRIVVSPEDSLEIEDTTELTRKIMRQVERDLGTHVDWVAVNHYNTPKPHTHIVVRGRVQGERDLIIARKYLMHGLRHRAETFVTDLLGPRDWRDRSVARLRETARDRLSSIDVQLGHLQTSETVQLDRSNSELGPYRSAALTVRLQQLRRLGLARHVYGPKWELEDGWQHRIEALARRNDALLAVASTKGDRGSIEALQELVPAKEDKWLTGRLVGLSNDPRGSSDPLLIIDGMDGRTWLSHIDRQNILLLPDTGGVVSVQLEPLLKRPKEREGPDLSLRLLVNSWLPVDQLVERRALTWLDELRDDQLADQSAGFGADVRAAKLARQMFLKETSIDLTAFEDLRRTELQRVAEFISAKNGKRYAEVASREVFRGEYIEHVDTSYGRFAVISSETRFTLTEMTSEISTLRGQSVSVERAPFSIGSTLWRSRGLER